jgi:hypothetical protein
MKPVCNLNQNGVKDSLNMYRNIKGIYYQQWTCDNTIFEEEKKKAKELGLKCRLINGELFREVK